MRLSILLTFIFAWNISASVFSQVVNFERAGQEISIKEVLAVIENQTEYTFFYNDAFLDLNRKVTVNRKSIEVGTLLNDILKNTELTYREQNDKFIVITPKILLQGISISGRVTDISGNPIPGVTVSIKGASQGTVTDAEGVYTLQVSDAKITLIFSYIGYVTQEIAVGSNRTINVLLSDDIQVMDEVVVVGYGTQKKVNVTGAVATVNVEKELASRPITNLSTALNGLTSGLMVMQLSGQPNTDGANIMIRGQGTLNTASPLILVDGIEHSTANINPNDVATISILKDAASCAIYGNRGANGVIIITTKKGSKGKVNVNYTGNFSYNKPSKLIQLVSNSADHMELINESMINIGINPLFTQTTLDKFRAAEKNPYGISESGYPNYVAYPNTDWYKEVFKSKLMNEQTVSVTGASEKVNYNFSGAYLDNPGLISGTGQKKYYGRSTITANITDWLQVGNRTWGLQNVLEVNDLQTFLTGLGSSRIVPGMYPYYDGKYGGPEAPEENPETYNPLWYMHRMEGANEGALLSTSFFADLTLFKDLAYHISVDWLRSWNENRYHTTASGYYSFSSLQWIRQPSQTDALQVYFYASGLKKWRFEQTLTYNKIFDKVHEVGTLAGYEAMYQTQYTADALKQGMVDESITALSSVSQMRSITGSDADFASRSFFGRVTYAYDSRYLLEANLRYDGSSRFAPQNRWGLFPSVSAGWRISQENFMANTPFNNLKLRASWGKLGNNSIGNYDWQSTYAATNYSFANTLSPGLAVTALANTALQWESTAITNLGLDVSFFKNRLIAEIDIYNKLTEGILFRPNLYLTMGNKTAALENIAQVSNKGAEITLGWNDQIGKLKYGVKGVFSYNRNLVTKYRGELEEGWITNANGTKEYINNIGNVSSGGANRIVEGKPINEFYMLVPYSGNQTYFNADGTVNKDGGPKDGMIRTEKDMEWLVAMRAAGYSFYPNQNVSKAAIWYGDYIYADLNGDGVYGNVNDNTFQNVNNIPKYNFGFQPYISWNNFDFSMNWTGAAGFAIYYYQNARNVTSTAFGTAIGKAIANDHYFYDPNNPNDARTNLNSKNSRLTYNYGSSQSDAVSSLHLEKGDFVKLKNLTFGYTIPSSVTQKIYVQSARVFVSGENLFTITGFTGMDPEMRTAFGYVTMRQYACGVNITF